MKAVICPAYGPPDILQIVDIPKPSPKDNEVLLKVRATTVTVADVRVRGFNIPKGFEIPARLMLGFKGPRNQVLGAECSGVVESAGRNVKSFKAGDEVFGDALNKMGCYAEYKCMPEKALALKPRNISFEEAAAIPIGAVTALYYLRKAGVKPGQKVLIYGASGSVGSYMVQIAKHFGALVTGVCSKANLDLVKSIGAEKVLDYKASDFLSRLEKYDAFIDAVDKFSFSVGKNHVTDSGYYMNITSPFKSMDMIKTGLTTKKKVVVGENPPWSPENLNFLKELVESRKLRVVMDRTYNLEEIVEAHRYVDQGHKKGNVAIRVS